MNLQNNPVRQQAATAAVSRPMPLQAQAFSRFRFQEARNPVAFPVQAQPQQQAFVTNPAQPQALNYAAPSYSSQMAQPNGMVSPTTVLGGAGTAQFASPAYASPVSSNAILGGAGIAQYTSPAYASPQQYGPAGHHPATMLTGVHPVTPSGVVVPAQAQYPAYSAGGSMALAAGQVHPAGMYHPAIGGPGGAYPGGAAVYPFPAAAGESGSETPLMLVNPYHPLHPMNPLNAASPNLRGYGGVPGSAMSGFPYGNQGTSLPPMPPGSRSYQESPPPPPPLEEIDTPDILSAPTPPVSPMQLRRFTTQADTGRGMVPSTQGASAAGGSMSVQMAMPGTAGTMADPSAPLSRADTLGIM